jgi:hypothetical protein
METVKPQNTSAGIENNHYTDLLGGIETLEMVLG